MKFSPMGAPVPNSTSCAAIFLRGFHKFLILAMMLFEVVSQCDVVAT